MKEFFEKVSRSSFCLLASLFILYIFFAYSLLAEFFYKYTACKLQLTQRYSVVVCIILITTAFLLRENPLTHKKLMRFSYLGLFIGGISALYKLMLHYKVVPEVEFLKTTMPTDVSLGELEAIINKNQMESCANPDYTTLGIPDSAYFLVMFIFLFVYLICCHNIFDGNDAKQNGL
ncbi:MAG: disulfide bond formation protein B [Holosporaceae bacterium]|jgi:disulfide bond formation protein DsbB|nr:disulfide bond formation protein B [Holosporaceae bacterium]